MSFKTCISIITVILLSLVIYFGRSEIVQAWNLLGSVNLWILSLLIPVQLISYYANGNTVFSYLKAKGDIKDLSNFSAMRMALEFNFVNHIMPSGGMSGVSYFSWLLSKHKVSVGRATMAQITRLVLYLLAFILILIVSVVFLALDHGVNRLILAVSLILTIAMIVGIFLLIFIIEKKQYLIAFSAWFTKISNKLIKFITFGRKKRFFNHGKIEGFFMELHQDYISIKNDKKILLRPFLWALLENITDVGLVAIAFLAIGYWVSPAVLFIAFGLAASVSTVSVIPGGAGVYEAIMVTFMTSSGVNVGVAVAGTLLARVVLLLGTIVFGYVFYQLTINKYGKVPKPDNI